MKIEAIVFDADGTLINSAELIFAAYEHVARTHSLAIPTEVAIRKLMGRPLPEMMRTLFPEGDLEELLQTNNTFVIENAARSNAYEGVLDILKTLHEQGIKLAILTSGSEKVNSFLAYHNIADYFSSVVHSGRVTRHKPEPEGFLLAANECGVNPQHTVMVGDMAVDVLTGKNVNALATIGVTHGFGNRESLEEAGADYIIDSLLELPEILKKLG